KSPRDAYFSSYPRIMEKVMETTKKKIVYGTLYNSLDNLVKKGLVTTYRGEPTAERGGRSKVYYNITDKGKLALQSTRALHTSLWDGISDFALGAGRDE
ncbi:PadR family transcriptional regulator, partial [candidate division KSB1 bacterium]